MAYPPSEIASDICKQRQSKKVWLIHLERLPVIFVNKDKVRRCGLSTLRDISRDGSHDSGWSKIPRILCMEIEAVPLVKTYFVYIVASTENQMEDARLSIERYIMSRIYTHAMFPNGDGDIMRDQ